MRDETTALADRTDETATGQPGPGDVLVEEVLVEEVSIDGMCGVY